MNSETLKHPFLRYKSGVIKEKSLLPLFISFILMPTFLIIFVTFLILYLSEASIEYNDAILYPSDGGYQRAFMTIFLIMGSLFAVSFLPMIFGLFIKSNGVIMWKTTYDNDVVIYQNKRRFERIIGPDYLITYHKLTNSHVISHHPDEIKQAVDETLFWIHLNDQTVTKINNHGRSITFQKFDYSRQIRHQYRIKLFRDGTLSHYTEMISYGSYGSNQIRAYNRNRFESVNQIPRFVLSEPMKVLVSQAEIVL